jgi:hypothetical protein
MIKWTQDACKQVALQYKRRGDFAAHRPSGAYLSAQRKGWLDEVCAHMAPKKIRASKLSAPTRRQWDEKTVREEALKHSTRSAFASAAQGAKLAAKKLGILDEVCSHMVDGRQRLARGLVSPKATPVEQLLRTARSYETRADLYRAMPSVYSRIYKLGIAEEAFAHCTRKRQLLDCIYVWRAVGLFYNGVQVYKVGIAAKPSLKARVRRVAARASVSADVVVAYVVGEPAYRVEQHVLRTYGAQPPGLTFEGHTEMRALTHQDLLDIKDYLHKECFGGL